MPLIMPTYTGFVNSDFYLSHNVQTFTSPLSGSMQRVVLPGAKWKASYTLPPMKKDVARIWHNFFRQLRGSVNTFVAYDAEYKGHRGNASSVGLVNGADQIGYSVITDGWGSNQIIFRVGDYIKINGELKSVTADIISDGAGNAVINFEPAIRNSPADNSEVIYYQFDVEMIITDVDFDSWVSNEAGVYLPKTFNAMEVLA